MAKYLKKQDLKTYFNNDLKLICIVNYDSEYNEFNRGCSVNKRAANFH